MAYDRADYRSALNVWLERAQEGDPEAQNYVGEIFEKGLGREPDYVSAAEWYRKAAEAALHRGPWSPVPSSSSCPNGPLRPWTGRWIVPWNVWGHDRSF